MFNALHRLIRRLVVGKCDHVQLLRDDKGIVVERINLCVTGGNLAISDWLPPEPHPHPKFSARLKIQRRRVAAVSYCLACDKVFLTFGHDQRDIAQSEGGTLRNDGTPKRGI